MRVLIFILLLFTGCQQQPKAETTNLDALIPLTVVEVTPGKDGETVRLKDANNGQYTMVVSIPNLEDNYIQLKVGDRVKVTGDYAESYPIQIFPKKIVKLN